MDGEKYSVTAVRGGIFGYGRKFQKAKVKSAKILDQLTDKNTGIKQIELVVDYDVAGFDEKMKNSSSDELHRGWFKVYYKPYEEGYRIVPATFNKKLLTGIEGEFVYIEKLAPFVKWEDGETDVIRSFQKAIEGKQSVTGRAWTETEDRINEWPFKLEFNGFTHANEFEGKISWPSLAAENKITGKFGDGGLAFVEIKAIKKGRAMLGCIYTLRLEKKNGKILGSYSCSSGRYKGEIEIGTL
ncbi:MAG: hypothetical protein JAY74_08755 [Candidatus Thiodiazotropha taylori]|nr:hypothetical protein [Candidatus Thiodiazotropha taylori]